NMNIMIPEEVREYLIKLPDKYKEQKIGSLICETELEPETVF
ncbi:27308_t:CDS:1, partial [Racocetra persica]